VGVRAAALAVGRAVVDMGGREKKFQSTHLASSRKANK
jgi:hypothetical protein